MILKEEQSIEVEIGNVMLVIKHNDVGYSIDTYAILPLDNVLIKERQTYFEDIDDIIFNDANQGL
mgnify:CR=1 FL=1|tara:strand:+ start:1436 stop:1630 length:195 start_codon:yes stop_codon:yes gene_type:complete